MGFNITQIINKYLPVKSIGGIGSLSPVPQGSQSGNPLGTLPSGAVGARLYLGSSDSITFTTASTQPSSSMATLIKQTNFAGTVSAVGAGQVLQDGWVDLSGNIWDINAANALESANAGSSPWNTGMLIRPANEASVNGRIDATVVYSSKHDRYVALRHSGTNSATCYAAGLASSGVLRLYRFVNGAVTTLVSSSAIASLTVGTQYVVSFKAIQNGSATDLTVTVSTTSGTVLSTLTYSDSNSSLQNVSGRQGVFVYWNTGGVQESDFISISTYAIGTIYQYTVSGNSTPNWDELLSNGQMIYIISVTGSPLFRWY